MATGEKAARRRPGGAADDRGRRADPATDDLSTETGPYAEELARRERQQELAEQIRREATRAFHRDA